MDVLASTLPSLRVAVEWVPTSRFPPTSLRVFPWALSRALVVFLTAWPTLRLWLRCSLADVAVVAVARFLACLCVVDLVAAVVPCRAWAVAVVADRTLPLSPPLSRRPLSLAV